MAIVIDGFLSTTENGRKKVADELIFVLGNLDYYLEITEIKINKLSITGLNSEGELPIEWGITTDRMGLLPLLSALKYVNIRKMSGIRKDNAEPLTHNIGVLGHTQITGQVFGDIQDATIGTYNGPLILEDFQLNLGDLDKAFWAVARGFNQDDGISIFADYSVTFSE